MDWYNYWQRKVPLGKKYYQWHPRVGTDYRKAKKVYGFYKTKAQRAAEYFSNAYNDWKTVRYFKRINRKTKPLRHRGRVNRNRYKLLTGTIRQRERYRRIASKKRTL
ncbi:hypothetical protein M9Y10_013253 [Tritrichomonas musculus]|uniref:AP2/ERF domain-containing protein n=1 Tax=Tritrichomonas musculus TaxID=1915356 RepID=A0ABR2I867_9EUKA